MPNRNGTGPMGMGPMSGRGAGRCGAGRGRGAGMGMGRRGIFQAPAEPTDDDTRSIKERVAELERRLKEGKN